MKLPTKAHFKMVAQIKPVVTSSIVSIFELNRSFKQIAGFRLSPPRNRMNDYLLTSKYLSFEYPATRR